MQIRTPYDCVNGERMNCQRINNQTSAKQTIFRVKSKGLGTKLFSTITPQEVTYLGAVQANKGLS